MRRTNRAGQAKQYDLFRTGCPKPEWRELPAEVREKATRLMARLLRERYRRETGERPGGGRDDE